MLEITIENQDTKLDRDMIEAIQQMIGYYPDDTIETAYKGLILANFKNHIVGRGGQHIWIKRKTDDVRIAVITE